MGLLTHSILLYMEKKDNFPLGNDSERNARRLSLIKFNSICLLAWGEKNPLRLRVSFNGHFFDSPWPWLSLLRNPFLASPANCLLFLSPAYLCWASFACPFKHFLSFLLSTWQTPCLDLLFVSSVSFLPLCLVHLWSWHCHRKWGRHGCTCFTFI